MVIVNDAAVAMSHPYDSTENSALDSFRHAKVDLTDDEMKLGRGLRDLVISGCEGISGTEGFPLLLKGESFLAGSLGRQTQAQALDDVDLYLVMNSGGQNFHESDGIWVLEGQTPGPLSNDLSLRWLGWVSADLVLARVAEGLARVPLVTEYNLPVGVNNKRQSAYITYGNINIDISPVVWARFDNRIDRYYMPQGHGSYAWKRTNPKEDQRRLSTQNQQQDGLLLPTIRMLKWWNDEKNGGRLKGILLETLTENGLRGMDLVGLAQALHLAFVSIHLALDSPPCEDPTDLGPPLDSTLSEADRQASIVAARTAHLHAIDAANAVNSGDSAGAVSAWANVFPGLA